MLDDFADRTEAPTPRRREQFRREGNVARSTDLSAASVLIAALLILSMMGPKLADVLETFLRQALAVRLDGGDPTKLFSASADSVMVALVPLLLVVLAVAVLVNVAQVGLPLTMHLRKRKPFSTRGGVRRFAIGLVKVAVIGFATYGLVRNQLKSIITAGHADAAEFFKLCWQVLVAASMRLALVLLAFGLIEYAWQRYRLSRQLRMTRREVRDELRQTEGDSTTRLRRRQHARERFRSSMADSPIRQSS